MIIVSNTTPLIGMASIGRFDLLHQIFGKIYIAQAVYEETFVSIIKTDRIRYEVPYADWIETVKVNDSMAVNRMLENLDLGEAETIVLASEIKADWVLMDEKKGRRKLKELGFNKIGTLGILIKAKQEGFLSVIRPDIERLCNQGFSISKTVVKTVLKQVNE
ncbi:DUF3368 [Desulfonema limicola]|uniref:DUF3368 n=1 Tax=Desulfonema limicola TaxID=45656 RepID=A0A975B3Y1_9BACT|nr:DUF3368 domain-containing protein [Desulfonema limicola]QTA78352.1 DUF3368 [Desulfonema limicola]